MKTLILNKMTLLIMMMNVSFLMNMDAKTAESSIRGGKTVSIVDNGFGMVSSTSQIPSDWQLKSNIYTNPYTGNIE